MGKQLKVHRSNMDFLAQSAMKPAEKFDRLAEIMATVLDEALQQPSPVKTYRFLDKFSKQNEASLDMVVAELTTWQKNLNAAQKFRILGQATQKPYAKKLLRTVPQTLQMMEDGEYKLGKLEKALVMFKLRQMFK
ncbi:MAG: hypothetical protein AAFR61_21255 [Bacteroidota bacterium]